MVLPEWGADPIGVAIIGVPLDQLLEFKEQYPDHEIRGPDPRIQFAVQDGITSEENEKIRSALDLSPETRIRFQALGIWAGDHLILPDPTFESDNRSFWIHHSFR